MDAGTLHPHYCPNSPDSLEPIFYGDEPVKKIYTFLCNIANPSGPLIKRCLVWSGGFLGRVNAIVLLWIRYLFITRVYHCICHPAVANAKL